MTEDEIAVFRAIGALTPQRATSLAQMARAVVRRDAFGGRSVDPRFVAGLAAQGYDPESYVRTLIEVDARDDD